MSESIKPVRSAQDYTRTLSEIESLIGSPAGSPGADRLEVLSVLAKDYERQLAAQDQCDPIDILNVAMRAQGRQQADLARVLGSRSRASELLKRRRLLSDDMIARISRAWGMPAALLSMPYRVRPSTAARIARGAAMSVLVVAAVMVTALGGALWHAAGQVPNSATVAAWRPAQAAGISSQELPAHVVKAFVAAEDQDFYSNRGVDFSAAVRATFNSLWRAEPQGASTISMQLARGLFLQEAPRTVSRKMRELVLAQRIDATWSRDRILETYLNQTYFGGGQWGLVAAARHYFGVAPAELSVSQAAYLAALPKAPNRYRLDLVENRQRAKVRRDWVLGRMAEDGLITISAAKLARDEPLLPLGG
jgi:penicillin-binding protein 1A